MVEARLPMATRPPRQTRELDAAGRELRDAQAAMDVYFRTELGLSVSPAPLDINILQTALDVLVQADDLAYELSEPSLCPAPCPPGLGDLDARPYLRTIRACLVDEHDDLGEPGPWFEHAGERVYRMYEQVGRALAMFYTGQVVKAVCPWCSGRTGDMPVGGAYTWRVEVLPNDQVAIMCYGVNCNPPADQVGTWLWGQPCWPITMWPKLAKHVMPEHERAARAREAIAS
ncbi:hypothetical protein ACBJ59_12235 [Nonomuraea sp. MTCD27]|uniref:hypothetical protein n=1 Tax=Nonomuraea sp. MTCD27 TaxID=1676747 RepID=UPI0035C1AF65